MTLLAIYGLPQAKPFDWVMDGGYGYSIRITPMLWQRDKVSEVFQKSLYLRKMVRNNIYIFIFCDIILTEFFNKEGD